VLWGSTALLALAVALVTMLALFEYFALGEAIGHRAVPVLDGLVRVDSNLRGMVREELSRSMGFHGG